MNQQEHQALKYACDITIILRVTGQLRHVLQAQGKPARLSRKKLVLCSRTLNKAVEIFPRRPKQVLEHVLTSQNMYLNFS